MIEQKEISIGPKRRGYHLVTSEILQGIQLPQAGLLHVFIKHTSAALTINENADPDVRTDFETFVNKIVPENLPGLVHTIEGPDDMPAHIKSSFIGSSVTIPITNGRLNLGTWQGIYLCEFRNRVSARKLVITIYH
ncbi:MAG TPA: secondary thiamine-phosphate synthase enzyme YjbQ [Saprospiraceae bacterium]|nr:secondary thiamine-phosphate synthase enzyme YjbQ [Saprospiraceae bacterium]HPN68641.1 secondary thiamine-phosphate synthase enzyme YjbQ [Saprospiraceae bacterium]